MGCLKPGDCRLGISGRLWRPLPSKVRLGPGNGRLPHSHLQLSALGVCLMSIVDGGRNHIGARHWADEVLRGGSLGHSSMSSSKYARRVERIAKEILSAGYPDSISEFL